MSNVECHCVLEHACYIYVCIVCHHKVTDDRSMTAIPGTPGIHIPAALTSFRGSYASCEWF